jgi:hypothetical protein
VDPAFLINVFHDEPEFELGYTVKIHGLSITVVAYSMSHPSIELHGKTKVNFSGLRNDNREDIAVLAEETAEMVSALNGIAELGARGYLNFIKQHHPEAVRG